MSTLFKELAARSAEHYSKKATVSMEDLREDLEGNDWVCEDELTEEFQETEEDLDKIEEHEEAIDNAIALESSFESLVNATFSAYGEAGMDERGAELYRLSVESLLKVGRYPVPVEVVVPSFEDAATRVDHTSEAQKKADGLLKRIWTWIANAFETMVTVVGDFIRKLMTNASGLEKTCKSLQEKAKDLKGEAKDGKISLGSSGRYLCDTLGRFRAGDKQIQAVVTDFQKFATTWGHTWNELTSKMPTSGGSRFDRLNAAASEAVRTDHVLKQSYSSQGFQMNPLPNHILVVQTELNSQQGLKSQKTEMETVVKSLPDDADPLTIQEIHSSLDRSLAAIDVYKKADQAVDKMLKNTRAFAAEVKKLVNAISVSQASGNPNSHTVGVTNVQAAGRSVVTASKIVQFGWTRVLAEYLQYVRANLKFTAASMNKYH